MTIHDALNEATHRLHAAGFDQPAYEARELLSACCGLSPVAVITDDAGKLTPEQQTKFNDWLERRSKGMPLAYLTKLKGFYKHEFAVEPGVLIPRPETELVIDVALRRLRGRRPAKIADLGAGTGCIGLSLLCEFSPAKLWAVEASPKAAAVIVKNAEKLKIYDSVQVDCIKVERWDPETTLDLIVANPPYIALNDPKVERAVHEFEPHAALYSGADGLDAIRVWSPRALEFLNRDGLFVCEIGAGQSAAVRAIMGDAGFREIEVDLDLAGHERVISGMR